MKVAVEISYRTVLVLNPPEAKALLDILQKAKLHEIQGYGNDALYKPTNEQFNIRLINDEQVVESFEEEARENN